MKTSLPPARSDEHNHHSRLLLLPLIFLVSCAATPPEKPGEEGDVRLLTKIETNNCTLASTEQDGKKGVVICIVFPDGDPDTAVYEAGCPVYTVFLGQPNGLPSLAKTGGPRKLYWQAVKLKDGGGYESIGDIDYRIVFDPFVGSPIKANKVHGTATSKKLACDWSNDMNSCIPGVEYKYTILKMDGSEPDPACPPLDPVFRINY